MHFIFNEYQKEKPEIRFSKVCLFHHWNKYYLSAVKPINTETNFGND